MFTRALSIALGTLSHIVPSDRETAVIYLIQRWHYWNSYGTSKVSESLSALSKPPAFDSSEVVGAALQCRRVFPFPDCSFPRLILHYRRKSVFHTLSSYHLQRPTIGRVLYRNHRTGPTSQRHEEPTILPQIGGGDWFWGRRPGRYRNRAPIGEIASPPTGGLL